MTRLNGPAATATAPAIPNSKFSIPNSPSTPSTPSTPDHYDLFQLLHTWSRQGRLSLRMMAKEINISQSHLMRIVTHNHDRVAERTLDRVAAYARRLVAKFGATGPAAKSWRLAHADLIRAWALPPDAIDDPVAFWRHKHKTDSWAVSRIADEVGYDESTISRVINSKYNGDMDALRARMAEAQRRFLGNHRGADVATTVAATIHQLLDEARGRQWLYVIHGAPGIGKTRALEAHSRTATGKRRSLVFTLAEQTSVKSILQEIIYRLGNNDLAGSTPQLLNRAIITLRRNPHLLVFDEVNNLCERPQRCASVLNTLRTINDNTWAGMVFCGTTDLFEFLNSPRTERLTTMIRTRVSVELSLSGVTRDEVEALLAAHFKNADTAAIDAALPRLALDRRGERFSLRRTTVFIEHVQELARLNELPETNLTAPLAETALERMRTSL